MKLEQVIENGRPMFIASGHCLGVAILAFSPNRFEARMLFEQQIRETMNRRSADER